MTTRHVLISLAVIAATACTQAQSPEAFRDTNLPMEKRVADLQSRLTLEEKVDICYGNFTSGGIPRLGIGPLLMLDGRQGLRPTKDMESTKTTYLPGVLALSCTWDEAACERFGGVLASELKSMNRHVLLAPMLNLVRSPLAGRNFENFGEDPHLVSKLGTAYIRGVQKEGIAACACLLVANDCEHRRHFTSSDMDERTLREVHLLPYEAASRQGEVWTMMTGNNLLNGVHCAQSKPLIQDLMKDKIGFDGVMITDWRAAYDTVPTALAGTDMTTGYCGYVFGNGNLLKAVKSGQVPMSNLDDKVRRVLTLYLRTGVINPKSDKPTANTIDSPQHRQAARELAAQSMVLLKNHDNLLPLSTTSTRRILLTGPAADMVIQGGGSGSVPSAVQITPLQGIKSAFADAQVQYLPLPAALRPGMDKAAVEWETTGPAKGKGKRRNANRAGNRPTSSTSLAELTAAARNSDVVIFVAAGAISSEGRDLENMILPGNQDEAIRRLAAANPRVIVALTANGAVDIHKWIDQVPAFLALHYSGQAVGDALADVLTGKVNPSAKLPYTFAKSLNDYPVHALKEWPARLVLKEDPIDPGMKPEDRKATHAFSTDYKEGLFVGYRWFEKHNIKPWFPFGFGLSYTTFQFGNSSAKLDGNDVIITCELRNTGTRDGAEIVQIYAAPHAVDVLRPARELVAFQKVDLKAGQSRKVDIRIPKSALTFYDVSGRNWKLNAGGYSFHIGNSQANTLQKTEITFAKDETFASK